jgi:rubrerythrin
MEACVRHGGFIAIMVDWHRLDGLLADGRRDVVSVLIDVAPGRTRRGASGPASAAWVRRAVHDCLHGLHDLPAKQREQAGAAAERILDRLAQRRLRARGVAFYAGPGLWEEFSLPVPLPNEVRYGAPNVMPLLWVADEYESYGILAVDRERARLFVSYLGRTSVVQKTDFRVNTRAWRKTAGRAPTSARRGLGGGAAARGADRETYEDRLDEQRRRFWDRAAERAAAWLDAHGIERVIIAGPDEASAAVRSLWPENRRVRFAGMVSLPPAATDQEIRDRSLPAALEDERRHEDMLVTSLTEQHGGRGGSVGGRGPTLQALAQQKVMIVIADRDIGGPAWRCSACTYISGSPAAQCPICSGGMDEAALRDVLPVLVRRNSARLELVSGTAAERMGAFEGMGGLLRFTESQRPPDVREATA